MHLGGPTVPKINGCSWNVLVDIGVCYGHAQEKKKNEAGFLCPLKTEEIELEIAFLMSKNQRPLKQPYEFLKERKGDQF